MKLAAISAAGALLLGSLGANWWLWSSLQAEIQDHADATAAFSQCEGTNADNQAEITGLRDDLEACARRHEAERDRWAAASARREAQIADLQQALDDADLQGYGASCAAWAERPVCDEVQARHGGGP